MTETDRERERKSESVRMHAYMCVRNTGGQAERRERRDANRREAASASDGEERCERRGCSEEEEEG